MSFICKYETKPDDRTIYLEIRLAMAGLTDDAEVDDEDSAPKYSNLTIWNYAVVSAAEELVLTNSAQGEGRLSRSYD